MKDLIDRAKSAILHHGTTGFEEIEEVNLYANESDDTPIVSGFAVHIDELPEPVIFQGSGLTAVEDMARAYVAMRRTTPEMIERLEEQEEERDRYREALEEIADAIEWDKDPRSIRHLCDMAEEALEDTDE